MVRLLLSRLENGRLVDLLMARHHPPYLTRHRLLAIGTRTRLVAAAFSVFTLLWIGFDALTLSTAQWPIMALARVIAVIIFIAIAIAPEREKDRNQILGMMGLLLAIPLALYALFEFLLAGVPLEGFAGVNADLYQTLPLIVLAGLSIFPLVTTEGLLFAAVIAITVAGVRGIAAGAGVIDLISTLWVLMLVLGVYLLACAIQLHYMMALLRRASHDPLTGALTRRSGVEILDLHFQLACDQDTPLSVLFLDADNFKSINDTFGHDAGDQVLKTIYTTLHNHLRQADAIIRWGGEEFIVILTNTPMSGAELVVQRIISDWLGPRPDNAPLTASMGLAERQIDSAGDWSQLITLADERMYVAKTSGKACCVNHRGKVTVHT